MEEIEKDQKELRERFAPKFASRPNAYDEELRYAIGYEEMAREFFTAVDSGYKASEEELTFNRRRLAQALQTQGRYSEALLALSVAPTDEFEFKLREQLLAEIAAIDAPDDLQCSCESSTQFPNTQIVKHVRVKGNVVPLIRCVSCGQMNATPQMPDDLSRQERIRAGKRMSDPEILKRMS